MYVPPTGTLNLNLLMTLNIDSSAQNDRCSLSDFFTHKSFDSTICKKEIITVFEYVSQTVYQHYYFL
jgi:hypothetical protein